MSESSIKSDGRKIIKYLDTDAELEHIKKLGLHVVPLDLSEERFEKLNTWETALEFPPEQIKLYNKYKTRFTSKSDDVDTQSAENYAKLTDIYKKIDLDEEYYFDIGKVIEIDGLQYLSLPPNTQFYKGVKYFYSKMIKSDYFWCGSKKTGMDFAKNYEGSLLIYKVENPINLLVLSDDNLKIIYDRVNAKEKEIISGIFGTNLTFDEYKSIMCLKKPSWCNELWFYNDHIISRDNPLKTRYPTHLNSGWDLHDMLYEKLPNLQGTIIPYHISCFNRDQFEEVNLNQRKNKITMISDDPLYWENWNLKLPPEDKFLLNENYPRNYNFKIYDWYVNPSHHNIMNGFEKLVVSAKQHKYRIFSYNVRKLTSANALVSAEQIIDALRKVISKVSPNIVVLQEFPQQHINRIKNVLPEMIYAKNGSSGAQLVVLADQKIKDVSIFGYNQQRKNICFNYNGTKISAICVDPGANYDTFRFFCTISEFMDRYAKNLRNKISQIKEILDKRSDIIIGDFNSAADDTEMKGLESYQCMTAPLTTVHNCKMDFAFWNKKVVGVEQVLEYYESDHKPIVFDFDATVSGGGGGNGNGDVGSISWMILLAMIIVLVILLVIHLFIKQPPCWKPVAEKKHQSLIDMTIM